jgi:hypothetical protein
MTRCLHALLKTSTQDGQRKLSTISGFVPRILRNKIPGFVAITNDGPQVIRAKVNAQNMIGTAREQTPNELVVSPRRLPAGT